VQLVSQGEDPKPEPIQGIITSQGGVLLQLVVVDKQKGAPPSTTQARIPHLSALLGERTA
jgi:hypothetical protein